jgi:hypothetical protein
LRGFDELQPEVWSIEIKCALFEAERGRSGRTAALRVLRGEGEEGGREEN